METEKPMHESYVEMTEFVLPNDANALGTAFGGKIMQWIDIAASISSMRHSRSLVVTAKMGQLDFLTPVKVGQIVSLQGRVIAVGNTSMEVQVKIFSEDPITGECQHTGTAALTYVAIDKEGNKVRVPRLKAETDEEKKLLQIGMERLKNRKR